MLKMVHSNILKNEAQFEERFNEIYLKSLKEVQNTPEYIQNSMQIDSIKKVLINNADVPEKLVTWLIEAVRNNTTMEYTVTNTKVFNYLKNNQMAKN